MALIGSLFRLGIKLGVLGAGAAGAGYLLDKARIGRDRALAPRSEPDPREPATREPAVGVPAMEESPGEDYTADLFGAEEDALNQGFETLADEEDGDGENEFIEDETDEAFVVRLEDEGHLDLESVDEGVVANGIAALEEADDRRHELLSD